MGEAEQLSREILEHGDMVGGMAWAGTCSASRWAMPSLIGCWRSAPMLPSAKTAAMMSRTKCRSSMRAGSKPRSAGKSWGRLAPPRSRPWSAAVRTRARARVSLAHKGVLFLDELPW